MCLFPIRIRTAPVLCLLALAAAPAVTQAEPIDADIVLRQGTVYDGRGGPPETADVAIRGDLIVAVGAFQAGKIGLELDCRGLVVAPGFIDLHNHSDSQIVDRLTRANTNYLLQGCTTIVTGNCGSGPVDTAAYYEKIAAAGAGTNVAHLVPQGSLREQVVGTAQRAATADELLRMQDLARQAMRDGAWGLSSGLIYVPSSFADTAELTALARMVGEGGGFYASHIRGEGLELLAAVQEALTIGRDGQLPVHISHFKSSGQEAWGLVRQAARLIEEARQTGQRVTADQYPYAASSTSLEATVIPAWARAGGQDALVARLDDPTQSPRIRDAMADAIRRSDEGQRLKIARYTPRPQWAGKSLAEIASLENQAPVDIAMQITRGGGAAIVNFSMSEEDVRFVMTLPWVATASDGRAYLPGGDRPHPRSYGTFARKIGVYSIAEHVIDLALAIRSATSLPAEILGLADRGTIRTGWMADLVVFDPAQFRDEATYDEPHRPARGVRYLLVNGRPAVWQGTATGALAGQPLKKPRQP